MDKKTVVESVYDVVLILLGASHSVNSNDRYVAMNKIDRAIARLNIILNTLKMTEGY